MSVSVPLSCFPSGLPDEKGRIQILQIHTGKMRQHNLLAGDVDISELAVETKNFSGAELEGLVRAAQSTAMNRHIKVRLAFNTPEDQQCQGQSMTDRGLCACVCVCVQASNTVEVNFETAERLQVSRLDFMNSLNNDIKPVSSSRSSSWRNRPTKACFLLRCSLSSSPGVRHQSGGLRQLHHERDHPLGRPGVHGPRGRRAAGAADKEQRPHAAGVGAAGR